MSRKEPVRVLPLWVGGHAYLTVTPAFFDVYDARSGEVCRRTPLCGAAEATIVVASAAGALADWAARCAAERASLLANVGEALAEFGDHFADLIVQETGKEATQAAHEVADAVAVLRTTAENGATATSGILAIIGDPRTPLAGPLRYAVPALLAGATVVVKPSPKAPSVAFAWAELTAGSGVPAGVVNVLHGDLAAVEGLCAAPMVGAIAVAGDRQLAAGVSAIAARYGRSLAP